MRCPSCGEANSKVLDSRDHIEEIRRRRSCLSCNYRFTTFERIADINLLVVKNNKTRQPYNREKLEKGIWTALEKRNISPDTVSKMIDQLEQQWFKKSNEISSKKIGESTMNALRQIDEVAYIRFASVYKDFKNIKTFEEELKKISSLN